MTTLPISADGQAIALACSTVALRGEPSLKPLTATQWHELSRALHTAGLRPRDLLSMARDDLRQTLGLNASEADRLAELLSRGGQLAFEVEHLASRGIWIVSRADEAYPARLKSRLKATAPPLLYGAGPQGALQHRAIAVVGSRDVNGEGMAFAETLGKTCAAQGWTIVSGAARGVDLAAMTSALSVGGAAVGISVDPLERLIAGRKLRMAIADELLTLATPFHPSARWQVGNAMRRNRLIYAMSEAAVVVASSTEKGGTRTGAVENLEAAWVPLHVRDDGSPGNRRLIAEGGWPLPHQLSRDFDIERLLVPARPSLLDDLRDAEKHPASVQVSEQPAPPSIEPGRDAARVEAVGSEVGARDEQPAPQDQDDVFFVVWPVLARHLVRPLTERELADVAVLELKQARVWLQRAVEEGLAVVAGRPKRYAPATHRRQMSIGDAQDHPRRV